ncbi:MAG: translocation/assembly module TamB domain-containing protein [Chitinophagales bacterium]|nr:translocation/assembly module TamB domain-containing protein [Bacteroidota bacterium]MCB9043266.1 translocation/assembly module TamB domain-containing protein [Chitinophagales bacterium]
MKIRYILGIVFMLLVLLLLTAGYFIANSSATQTWLTHETLNYLAKKLETEVKIDSVKIEFWDKINLHNIYIADQQKDTLLYAQNLKANIDLWQLLSGAILIEEVDLNTAKLNLKVLPDSTWNFQFIINKLSSPEKTSPQTNTTPLQLAVEVLNIRNAYVQYAHIPNQQTIETYVPSLHIVSDKIDLSQQYVRINNIELEKPLIAFSDLSTADTATRERSFQSFLPWQICVDSLAVFDAAFRYDKGTFSDVQKMPNIDFKHLNFDTLSLRLTDLEVSPHVILGDIQNVQFREKNSDFELLHLQTNLYIDFNKIAFDSLRLQTPHSSIGNSISLTYRSFNDFSNLLSKVKINAVLEKASVDVADVLKFIPAPNKTLVENLERLKKLQISGNISGNMQRLTGRDLDIQIGNQTHFVGNIRASGLDDAATAFIDLKVEQAHTNIVEVKRLLPKGINLPSNLDQLGNIAFQGYFTGFPKDFVAQGNIQTDLGNITSDINVKLKKIASYSGNLEVKDFQLGKWLNNENIGKASFEMSLEGQGLKRTDILINAKGKITELSFNNYSYRNIAVNGKFDRYFFSGDLAVSDENLALNFDGTIDFNEVQPRFVFDAAVSKAKLQQLKLSDKAINIALLAKLDVRGLDIDEIVGSVELDSIHLETPKRKFQLKDMRFSAAKSDEQRVLDISSGIADINISGNYQFKVLPQVFKQFINTYIPQEKIIAQSFANSLSEQNFEINATIKNIEPLVEIFAPKLDKLQKLDRSELQASFDSKRNSIDLNVKIPFVNYDNFVANKISIEAHTENSVIYFNSQAKKLGKKDAFQVQEFFFTGNIVRDTLKFNLMSNLDSLGNTFATQGNLYQRADTILSEIQNFVLFWRGEKWQSTPINIAYWREKNIIVQNFSLSNGAQKISLDSYPDPENKQKNTSELNLEAIDLAEIGKMLQQHKLGLSGIANGKITINDVFNEPLFSGTLNIADFGLLRQYFGMVNIKALKEPQGNFLNLEADVNGPAYTLTANGNYDLGKTAAQNGEALDVKATIHAFDLRFFESILGENIANTQGSLQGTLAVTGNFSKPILNGSAYTLDAQTTISYLQVPIKVANQFIEIEDNTVLFEDLSLFEGENTATLNGSLYLNDFRDLSTEIIVQSEKFTFLNTGPNDNELFYGTAVANGYVVIDGHFNDLYMYINATSQQGTFVRLPITGETTVSQYKYFTFVNIPEDKLKEDEASENNNSRLRIEMLLNSTPDARLEIILNPVSDEKIVSRGVGSITLNYDSRGDFQIYGDYNISSGAYYFNYENIVKKEFNILPNSSITFLGDPYKALLNVTAQYEADNISAKDIMQEDLTGDNSQMYDRVPVLLNLYIDGVLEAPELSFALLVNDAKATSLNPDARRNLDDRFKEINSGLDDSQLNRQVFAILVFKKFFPENVFDAAIGSTPITSSISDFLSDQLNTLIKQAWGSFIPNSDISFNWDAYDTQANNYELKYTQYILDGRVVIDVTGQADINNSSTSSANGAIFAGDFVIQYNITSDGLYRLKLYSKTDEDILNGRYNRWGMSVSVSEEFDDFDDLKQRLRNRFGRKKSKGVVE